MKTTPKSAELDGPQGSSQASSEAADAPARLLAVAGPIFARHGYDRATLREISREAGTNVAAVGYYFGDKMGLYLAVVDRIRDARDKQFPTPVNTATDPRLNLYRFVHALLCRVMACDDSSWESQLLMREMSRPTAALSELVEKSFRPSFTQLIQTIEQIVGETLPRHESQQLALSVIGQCLYYRVGSSVLQILVDEQDRQEHYGIDSLARHITAVTLAGLEQGAAVKIKASMDNYV